MALLLSSDGFYYNFDWRVYLKIMIRLYNLRPLHLHGRTKTILRFSHSSRFKVVTGQDQIWASSGYLLPGLQRTRFALDGILWWSCVHGSFDMRPTYSAQFHFTLAFWPTSTICIWERGILLGTLSDGFTPQILRSMSANFWRSIKDQVWGL